MSQRECVLAVPTLRPIGTGFAESRSQSAGIGQSFRPREGRQNRKAVRETLGQLGLQGIIVVAESVAGIVDRIVNSVFLIEWPPRIERSRPGNGLVQRN